MSSSPLMPHAHIVDMDLDGSKLLADAQFLGDAQVHRLIATSSARMNAP
jgi:hypothetical protein